MAIHPLKLSLLLLFLLSLCACQKAENPYVWPIPADFPKPTVPADNPMSGAKVELGRYLFYDKQLSANQQQSCSSCHQQAYAFAEPNRVSVGSTGQQHRRNALALVNIAYNKTLTWAHDGLTEIEQQQLIPMFGDDPVELGITGHETEILARLNRGPYPALFQAAFGETAPNFQRVNQALASFVRRLISLQSPFDRYAYQNDDNALTAQQLQGMELFFPNGWSVIIAMAVLTLPSPPAMKSSRSTGGLFHNTGLYYVKREQFDALGYPDKDRGLAEVSLNAADDGRFRAPTLRNISLTAPYMHDGSIATLPAVLDFYLAGGRQIQQGPMAGDGRLHPQKSPFIKPIDLTEEEKAAVLAFLHSLTDPVFISNPSLANPWQD